MPKKPAQEAASVPPTGGKQGQEYVPTPQRVARALELLMPQAEEWGKGEGEPVLLTPFRPGYSYTYTRDTIMREFDVSETTAERDLSNAYAIIRDRVSKTDYATMARLELHNLAQQAMKRGEIGDYSVARGALEKLGKWAGLESNDEESLVKKLSDAALEVAIKNAAKEAMANMTDEEFEALAQQRKERAA